MDWCAFTVHEHPPQKLYSVRRVGFKPRHDHIARLPHGITHFMPENLYITEKNS